jgi:diguanylate cyclase (GGDEF)-like protein
VTVRTKILAAMAVPFVVLAAGTTVSFVTLRRSSETLEAERHTYAVREAVQTVLNDLIDAETGMRGYLLTAETDFLGPYTSGVARLTEDLDRLATLSRDDASQVGDVERLRHLANVRVALLQQVRAFAPVTELTNEEQLIRELNEGLMAMEEVRGIVSDMKARAARLLQERRSRLDAVHRVSFLIGVIGIPIAVLAALVVVLLFTQRVAKRIQAIEANARRLEDGVPMLDPGVANDELGRLERALVTSGSRVVELRGELQRLATMDPLTRLVNRRGFVPMAEHRLEIARRAHEPLALLFVDIDDLKQVNDTRGHKAGDWVIAETAYVLRTTFRASDLIARMGGDEFCVLFAADSGAAVATAIDRLRATIVASNQGPDRPFLLAMSTGAATFDPEEPRSLDELLAEADRRMYEEKSSKQEAGTSSVG